MDQLSKIFTHNDRWQIWYWVIVLIEAPFGSLLGNGQTMEEAIIFRLVGMLPKMMAGYFFAYYLLPQVLFKRRYLLFGLLLPLASILLTIIARVLNIYVAEAIMYPEMPNESLLTILEELGYTFYGYFVRVFPFAFWFAFIKVGLDQVRYQQQLVQLREEKATAELKFLKAQIHPHFLFNTLNNLYSLSLDKSDEAPGVVVKLSEILDYVLYQCNAPRVPIIKEVELIQNYLGLEALRYGERLDLSFDHRIKDPNIAVAPLLLLSPVENAFKHGVSGVTNNPKIKIDLAVEEATLHFRVWNTRPEIKAKDEQSYTEGIGLKNIRSQLQLTYPDRHQLDIEGSDHYFQVDLQISLKA